MTTTLGNGFRPMVALLLAPTSSAGDAERDARRDARAAGAVRVRQIEEPHVSSRADWPLSGRRATVAEWNAGADAHRSVRGQTHSTGEGSLFYFYPRWALTTSLSITAARFTSTCYERASGGFLVHMTPTPLTASIAWLPAREC